ncbi:hypothetical protein CEQ21_18320 [Niallia circulans]|uniref:Uncharacterized protein n=1 Tax=Niallia circulans TaxID=1397 RepID=A0A553SKA3_NIACI|nr:hypothetical protein [Niallia circulans]TRZ37407.1 hypothetical protein CEQ21_18320 [Niallia circulans]
MISYVLALFSLILIVPIVYFLPLGFTKKGKWWIIGAALFTSVCGLLTQKIFEWWQTVLFMLLFLIIFTYLFIKKSSEMMFDSQEDEEEWEDEMDWELATADQAVPQKNRWEMESKNDSFLVEEMEVEPVLAVQSNTIVEEEEIIPAISVEEEFMKSDFSAKEDVNIFAEVDEIILEEKSEHEEISEIDVLPIQTESTPDEDKQSESYSYMEELERLMSSKETEDLQKTKPKELEAGLAEYDISLLENIEEAAVSLEEDQADNLEEEKLVDEDWTVADKIQEQEAANLVEEMEYLELEDVEAMADDIVSEPVKTPEPMMELMDGILEDNTEEISNEHLEVHESDSVPEEAEAPLNVISHQVINNTLMQLKLMKNRLDKEEYESILVKCLTDTLPLHEYFTISNLLIEHFVQQNEHSKLESFFAQLQTKYEREPIILEQLNFMEKNYLNK